MPDPQRRLTVAPGTSTGMPASSAAMRADVAVVLARLVRRAQDHVVDRAGRDAGPLEQGADHVRGHVVRPHLAQGAAVAAERRAEAVDDDGGMGWIGPHRADPSTGLTRG